MVSIQSFYNNLTIKKILFAILIGAVCLTSYCKRDIARETILIGSTGKSNNTASGEVVFKDMLGVNVYEWNFLAPQNSMVINESNMAIIKSFSSVRHYMDWNKLEVSEGNYTFNPTHEGGWNYDAIYTRCKQDGILVLADLKNSPPWLLNTYPEDQRDGENAPLPFGANKSDPASYVKQARAAFQFAARYGYSTNVDQSLVKVNTAPRWNADPVNTVKIGMGLIKYIECGNEADRWWGKLTTRSTPEEYAANLSAFYDGNKGKLGNNAGVKNADPGMLVVMGGLASNDVTWITRIIDWCKTNRGYKADGSVDVCFDVINYHFYSSKSGSGVAPELSESAKHADNFVKTAKSMGNNPEVWITESGYDVNPGSTQRAIAIGNKSALITQADWILRSAFLYMRHGIAKSFFYQLFDDTSNSGGTYATSGLAAESGKRPAADYILQATKIMGDYSYIKTINADPIVDEYRKGDKVMYVLTIPDQTGRTGKYTLTTANNNPLTQYTLKAGADAATSTTITPAGNKVTVDVSETPVFIGN
jgi:hypothetical protein